MSLFNELAQARLFRDLPEPSKSRVSSALRFFDTSHEIANSEAEIDKNITSLQIRFHMIDHYKTTVLNHLPLNAFADATPEKQLSDQILSEIENIRSSLSQKLSEYGFVPFGPDEAEQAMISQLRSIVNGHDCH